MKMPCDKIPYDINVPYGTEMPHIVKGPYGVKTLRYESSLEHKDPVRLQKPRSPWHSLVCIYLSSACGAPVSDGPESEAWAIKFGTDHGLLGAVISWEEVPRRRSCPENRSWE